MNISLTPQPLTVEAFASFGQVIEADRARSRLINADRARRFDALAMADVGGDGEVAISIFRSKPWPSPIRVKMLERHPLGTQAFVPMERHPWLVVAAACPEPEACRAFFVRGDQGLQFAIGTWHHPLIVLQPTQDFLVVDRKGPGENLEEYWFDDAIEVVIDPV